MLFNMTVETYMLSQLHQCPLSISNPFALQIQPSIPHLRTTSGRIVLVSSGAATSGYLTWGAYGSSKAAMNHLALTLGAEEPNITTISVRPGVVDTAMQQEIRETHHEAMGESVRKFKGLHERGELLRAEQPGNVVARLVVHAEKDLSGKFLRYVQRLLKWWTTTLIAKLYVPVGMTKRLGSSKTLEW